jgi:hypothetical protein
MVVYPLVMSFGPNSPGTFPVMDLKALAAGAICGEEYVLGNLTAHTRVCPLPNTIPVPIEVAARAYLLQPLNPFYFCLIVVPASLT